MSKTQARLSKVLGRLSTLCIEDEDFATALSDDLQNFLDEIQSQDGFGTEGQNDPRGDFRDGEWSMNRVQGIDD